MKRLFIATAVELDEYYMNLSQRLRLQLQNDKIVWVASPLQHLTLRFLGQTPDKLISQIKRAMNDVANDSQAFALNMDKMGVFGSKYAPSVIWLGFNEFAPYKSLFEKMEEQIINMGFEPNHGNLVPHLTLGRVKETQSKPYFWEIIEKNKPTHIQKVPVNSITLFQSHLQPTGPIYTPLHTARLKQ